MLGVGFFEIVIIALVCFIAFGPKQLPAIMRKIAQFYRQFASLRDELRMQIMSVDDGFEAKPKTAKESKHSDEIIMTPKGQDHG
jgi:Sec-independent protein translocase protein TatA